MGGENEKRLSARKQTEVEREERERERSEREREVARMSILSIVLSVYLFLSLSFSLQGAFVARFWRAGLLVNRSSDRSSTRGIIHNKILILRLSPVQYSLSAASWPKTAFISFLSYSLTLTYHYCHLERLIQRALYLAVAGASPGETT